MIFLYYTLAKTINDKMIRRFDGSPALPYYSPEELGLSKEGFTFKAFEKSINGFRFYYPLKEGQKFKGLIIFFHGLGAGANAYLKEISFLAKQGYLVYAYDNLGCEKSCGENIRGLGSTFEVQQEFFKWLDGYDYKSNDLPRYVVGHSWGGYAALLALNPAYNVQKSVSLAGFYQPSRIYLDQCPKLLRTELIRHYIRIHLLCQEGWVGDTNALQYLNKTEGKLLYIQGLDDKDVLYKTHCQYLKKKYNKNNNFKFITIEDCGHGVQYTKSAQQHQKDCIEKGILKINSDPSLKMDIKKATELNKDVMNYIIDFLDQ